MVYWWQQEYRFWFAWVWVLLHVLYNQKSSGWAFAKKAPPGGKLFCLWLKIWTCFGEAPEQGRSLPFWTETLMSLSLLKYLFCFAAAWEGFWDIRLLCTVGKSNCYVELCELLSISEFLYPIYKTKGAGLLLFCFLSCCLCLDCELSGTDISMCTKSVIMSFCLVAVLLLYYEELATTPKYLPNFALRQKNI